MSSLRAIRKRIRSVKGTEKITRAMKMVATSKLRRAQQELSAIRPFAENLQKLMARIVAAARSDDNNVRLSPSSLRLMEQSNPQASEKQKVEVLMFTSERGLCGGFNNNILREAKGLIHNLTQKGIHVSVSAFGKKGVEAATQQQWSVCKPEAPQPNAQQAAVIAQDITKRIVEGNLDEVWLAYTEFGSPMTQTPQIKPLLPLHPQQLSESQAPNTSLDPIWEPDLPRLLDALLIRYISTCVQLAALESFASEQGARMTAMESASDNAQEMIASLTLQYNRARQAAITTELMEIIGGAEALQA